MPSSDERLAALEERVSGLRDDMTELKDETFRSRRRLHDLEGIAGVLVAQEKRRNRDTRENQRRTQRRLSVLTVVIAAAALFEPFLYHLVTGR